MSLANIIPITKARANLSDLTQKVKGENYIILTKGGEAEVALVDIDYLQSLEAEIKKIYGKTYINPTLLPVTRAFSQKEINTWGKEDTL